MGGHRQEAVGRYRHQAKKNAPRRIKQLKAIGKWPTKSSPSTPSTAST